jgi:hypothetical protein
MSPEYALGRSFDHTLDLFALGASLYEAALGQAAFEGADAVRTVERLVLGDVLDPVRLRPDFPAELARILSRTMNSARSLRYESGSLLATELDRQAGLTATEARARLSARMHALFSQEIASDAGIFAEIRALRPAPAPDEATPLHHEVLARVPEPPPRPRFRKATLLAAAATIGVALWLFRPVAAPPAPHTAAAPLATPATRLEPAPRSGSSSTALAAQSADVARASPAPAGASGAPLLPPAPRSLGAARRRKATSGELVPPTPTTTPEPPRATGAQREPSGVIRANPFAGDP